MTTFTDDPKTLVSTAWLAAHLKDPDLRVIDASWYLPDAGRDAKAEYQAAHIPGARFFDIAFSQMAASSGGTKGPARRGEGEGSAPAIITIISFAVPE